RRQAQVHATLAGRWITPAPAAPPARFATSWRPLRKVYAIVWPESKIQLHRCALVPSRSSGRNQRKAHRCLTAQSFLPAAKRLLSYAVIGTESSHLLAAPRLQMNQFRQNSLREAPRYPSPVVLMTPLSGSSGPLARGV